MTRRRLILGLVVIVSAVGGAVAWAAIPDGTGVIHGCYTPKGSPPGKLRVIDTDAGQKCKSAEKALNWNVQGPKGDPGGSNVVEAALQVPAVQCSADCLATSAGGGATVVELPGIASFRVRACFTGEAGADRGYLEMLNTSTSQDEILVDPTWNQTYALAPAERGLVGGAGKGTGGPPGGAIFPLELWIGTSVRTMAASVTMTGTGAAPACAFHVTAQPPTP